MQHHFMLAQQQSAQHHIQRTHTSSSTLVGAGSLVSARLQLAVPAACRLAACLL